jgi:hypothetical protein
VTGWAFGPNTEMASRRWIQGCALRWMTGWAFGPKGTGIAGSIGLKRR